MKVSIGFVLLSITLAVYLVSLASWITTLKVGEKSVLLIVQQMSDEAASGAHEEIHSIVQSSEEVLHFNARMFEKGIYRSPLDLEDVTAYNKTIRAVEGFRSQVNGRRDIILHSQIVMIDRKGRMFGVFRRTSEYSGEWQTENVSDGSFTRLQYDTYPLGHTKEGRIVTSTPPIAVPNYNGTSDSRFMMLLDRDTGELLNPPVDGKWGKIVLEKGKDNIPLPYATLSQVVYGGTKEQITLNDPSEVLGVVATSVPLFFLSDLLAQIARSSAVEGSDPMMFVVDASEGGGLLIASSTFSTDAEQGSQQLVRCVNPSIPVSSCTEGNLVLQSPATSPDSRIRDFSAEVLSHLGHDRDDDWMGVGNGQFRSNDGNFLVVVSAVESEGLSFKIVIVVDEYSAMAEVRSLNALMISLQVLSGVFQISICFLFAQRVRKPLHRLIFNIVLLQRLDIAAIEAEDAKELVNERNGCCSTGQQNDEGSAMATTTSSATHMSPYKSPQESISDGGGGGVGINIGSADLSASSTHSSGPAKSWLKEIAALQEGHEELMSSLKRVTAFVPQSLLAELRGDDDDDDDDGEAFEFGDGNEHHTDDDEGPMEDRGNEAVFSPMGGGGGTDVFGLGSSNSDFSDSKDNSKDNSRVPSRTASFKKHSTQQQHQNGPKSSRSSSEGCVDVANSSTEHSHQASRGAGFSASVSSAAAASLLVSASSPVASSAFGSIQRCRVSMVYINFSGFHRVVLHQTGSEFTALIGTIAAKVVQRASAHRGVLDFFQGDHFILSFNAVKNCAQHVRNAIVTAIEIKDACSLAVPQLQMKAGCASSAAFVGNIGSSEARRFGIIGNCYTKAKALSSICNIYSGVPILVPRAMVDDCGGSVIGELIDVVAVPQIPRLVVTCPRTYVKLNNSSTTNTKDTSLNDVSSTPDEWMYDLRSGEGKARYQRHNQLFLNFISGGEDCMAHSAFMEHGKQQQQQQHELTSVSSNGEPLDLDTSNLNQISSASSQGKGIPSPAAARKVLPQSSGFALSTGNSKEHSDGLKAFTATMFQHVSRQKQMTPAALLDALISNGVDGTTYVNPLTQRLPKDAAVTQPQLRKT